MIHVLGNQILRSKSQKLQVSLNQMFLENIVSIKILFASECKKRAERIKDIFKKLYIWNKRCFQ